MCAGYTVLRQFTWVRVGFASVYVSSYVAAASLRGFMTSLRGFMASLRRCVAGMSRLQAPKRQGPGPKQCKRSVRRRETARTGANAPLCGEYTILRQFTWVRVGFAAVYVSSYGAAASLRGFTTPSL